MKKLLTTVLATLILLVASQVSGDAQNAAKEKTTSLKGTVYRDEKDHPVADAVILLLDDQNKKGAKDKSVETKTDAQGNFVFESMEGGKYTVSIRAWHKTKEEAPCKLLIAKTKDKNSTVVVFPDGDKFVEQIFIKDFAVKGGKENLKDFDITCKNAFGG
jgi:uncharacterized Zn ribbon protein